MSLLLKNYFIPKDYEISLTLNDLKPNYSGKVTIHLLKNKRFNESLNDNNEFFSITLNTAEIISMSATLKFGKKSYKLSYSLNKQDQTTKYYSNDLKLNDLNDSTNLILEINFLAVIRKIMTYNDITKGVFSTKYTDPISGKSDRFLLSTHSQPYYARYIFPCLDDLNCKSSIQLNLTVDNKFTCVSNLPIESSNFISETSNKLVKFVKSPLMTTSVFSFAVGDFDYIENIVEIPVSNIKLPVRIYTMIGDSERGSFALDIVSSAIKELAKKFNVNYPLPKLDIMALPFLSDGGVENWSMIQVINDHILLPDWKISDSQLSKLKKTITDVLVHEIVHMYVGNYITFDNYDYTWMNEAYATFMSTTIINSLFDNNAWYKFLNTDLQQLKSGDMSIHSNPIFTVNSEVTKIHDTFSRNSYDKGIFIIRTLASLFVQNADQLNNENYDIFFKMIGDFIKLNEYGNFKPVDLWNFLKSHESNKFNYDIPTIMNSWIRTPGFPILTLAKENNGSIKIEQHRCLDDPSFDIEDVPFHIPLLIKKLDGTLGRQLMTDRSLIISTDDEQSNNFFFLNANDSIILNIAYPESIAIEIASNFNVLNSTEQLAFFKSFSSIIGTNYQTNETIVTYFKVIKAIKKINKPNHTAMGFALSILSNVYKSIKTLVYFDDSILYKKLNIFIDELANKYIAQLEWGNIDWNTLSIEEIKLRNAILSLKYDNISIQNVGKKLFKKVMHGPKESIPVEILNSIFAIIAQSCTLKDYKEISKLVRNPGLIVNNIIRGTPNDVQTASINALGFMVDQELIHKTLMFVATNPDVKMIELSLLGFRFQMSAYKELWKWYLSHYTVWYSRFVRDNKSYQGLFFKHVSELALECAYYDPSLRKEVETFVSSKNDDVKQWFEEAKEKFDNVKLINEANSDLKLYL
jgi:hypothetical protein